MHRQIDFLVKLRSQLALSRHRAAIILDGNKAWQLEVVSEYLSRINKGSVAKLGGDELPNVQALGFKQGHFLLGSERDTVIFDDRDGFDANSFTASTGCLTGGGLYFLLINPGQNYWSQWLKESFAKLICLSENGPIPAISQQPLQQKILDYSEQKQAVELILHVLKGHRKRPLVITADRGRGKSAALGMASAMMMQQNQVNIIVTAPARKSVDTLFEHAKRLLPESELSGLYSLEFKDSKLCFIPPDELIQNQPECDILLVDEASAIPLPMLISITKYYHRVVFSTTVHGYEGCGRGFTLKFSEWLDLNRPGWCSCRLKEPIRWALNDPLENWLFSTFLLNAEVDSLPMERVSNNSEPTLKLIAKNKMSEDRQIVRNSFALLVAAHYQTSPNDLMQLLRDDSTHLIHIEVNGVLIGCMLVHLEGGMDIELIREVATGKRRPKGHMVASTLVTQCGIEEAAVATCLRVMRIAIHPEAQRLGLGSRALTLLKQTKGIKFDYLSTSFGVTSELYYFWINAGFYPVRLGAKRDPASGTHSILMIHKECRYDWFSSLSQNFIAQLISLLPETFNKTDPSLLSAIFSKAKKDTKPDTLINFELIKNYCFGAVSYESVFWDLYKAVSQKVSNETQQAPPIIISKILQRVSWQQVVSSFGFTGRKQVEQQLKQEIALYFNLQCKAD